VGALEEACEALRSAVKAAEKKAKKAEREKEQAVEQESHASQREKLAADRIVALESELAKVKELSSENLQTATRLEELQNSLRVAEERSKSSEAAAALAKEIAESSTQKADAKEVEAGERIAAAERRTAETEAELLRFKEENESRRQKFSVLHASFAKKETEMRETLELAEAEAATARATAAEAEDRLQLSTAAAEKAIREASEALDSVEASILESTAPLEQRVTELQDHVQELETRAAAAQAELIESKQCARKFEDVQRALIRKDEEIHRLEASVAEALDAKAVAEARCNATASEVALLLDSYKQLQAEFAAAAEKHALPPPEKEELIFEEQKQNAVPRAENVGDIGRVDEAETFRKRAENMEAELSELKKQNKDLAWQIAMLTRGGQPALQPLRPSPPGSVAVNIMPATPATLGPEDAGKMIISLPRLTGLVLRYRRPFILAYVVLLHILVYFSAVRCG